VAGVDHLRNNGRKSVSADLLLGGNRASDFRLAVCFCFRPAVYFLSFHYRNLS